MAEFAGVREKTWAYLRNPDIEKKRAKGIKNA